MLIPLGICPRPLARNEALPHISAANQLVKTPPYASVCKSSHQYISSIIAPCGLHAFALPELAERENLNTQDRISSGFPHQRRGRSYLRCPCLCLLRRLVLLVPEPRFVRRPARVVPGLHKEAEKGKVHVSSVDVSRFPSAPSYLCVRST